MFSVKGAQSLTHGQELPNPLPELASFFASGVLLLETKLGALLWQIPERLHFTPDIVEHFLALLPRTVGEALSLIARHGDGEVDPRILALTDRPIRHAFEARHPSFAASAFAELLRHHDIAAAFTNSHGWPAIRQPASDFGYLRLHGDIERFPRGCTDPALEDLTALIRDWRTGTGLPDGRPREVFIYFDNPDHAGGASPHIARRLQQLLDGPGAVPLLPEPEPTLF